jgi:hypothetical protein
VDGHNFHDAKVEPPLCSTDGIVMAVVVDLGSAEELLEDGGGPRRDILVEEELCAYLNCGRGRVHADHLGQVGAGRRRRASWRRAPSSRICAVVTLQ